jgi:hypothetical protein
MIRSGAGSRILVLAGSGSSSHKKKGQYYIFFQIPFDLVEVTKLFKGEA